MLVIAAWIVAVILFLILVALIDNGQFGWSLALLVAAGVLIAYGLGVTLALAIAFVIAHPMAFLIGAIGYFAVGTVWSVVKWWFLVRKAVNKLLDGEILYHHGKYINAAKPPQVGDYKEDIMTWMTFWPVSMAWTVVDDPVRKICSEIFRGIKGFLQNIADSQFKRLANKAGK